MKYEKLNRGGGLVFLDQSMYLVVLFNGVISEFTFLFFHMFFLLNRNVPNSCCTFLRAYTAQMTPLKWLVVGVPGELFSCA